MLRTALCIEIIHLSDVLLSAKAIILDINPSRSSPECVKAGLAKQGRGTDLSNSFIRTLSAAYWSSENEATKA